MNLLPLKDLIQPLTKIDFPGFIFRISTILDILILFKRVAKIKENNHQNNLLLKRIILKLHFINTKSFLSENNYIFAT